MGSELKTEIEYLSLKKHDCHMAMGKPFEYGRSPSDEEYRMIIEEGLKLRLIESSLETLKDVLASIESNARTN